VTPDPGKFNPLAEARDNGGYRYAHDLISGKHAPAAVTVLRTALASSDDGSVVIAQVGFSTNLANLLDSPPDEISPLGGNELVRQKVRLLSIMAGAFAPIIGGDGKPYDHQEYNVIKDLAAAKKLASQWPTPIVWSGFEIGIAVPYPHDSIEQDYRYVEHHPLAEAYVAYNPPPHDRPTWDLTSVLYAVRPGRDYFTISPPGRVTIADNGLTRFGEEAGGLHRHLMLSQEQRIRVTETLVGLSSQPPTR
jgi:inosine-uridine nucleoside N-ribohydrolase